LGVPRIFCQDKISSGQRITLSKEASHHISGVLRMHPGETLILFCGDNREFYATIVSTFKNSVVVDITAVDEVNRESSRAIHLAQGLSKGERFEWVVQKAVELGVVSITPFISSRCAVRLKEDRLIKKQLQWQAIATAACEQSGRNWVPTVHPVITYADYLQQCVCENRIVLDPLAKRTAGELHFDEGDVALLVGPEGGFTTEEIQQAQAVQFEALKLGPRTLRTETAAIVGLAVLQATAGDL